MKHNSALAVGLLGLFMLPAIFAKVPPSRKDSSTPGATTQRAEPEDDARLEGEKRFQANCSRCHQAPHKFPPRMMVTIERHMRVRALVTEQDMRLILHYMTQ
ncbi:MAG: hypothetical protein DMG74_22175 [Acidobacteria bacterium]|nr:MAG: hypothetical protein DMG74_22175 [Acidobacteriota bacterium]